LILRAIPVTPFVLNLLDAAYTSAVLGKIAIDERLLVQVLNGRIVSGSAGRTTSVPTSDPTRIVTPREHIVVQVTDSNCGRDEKRCEHDAERDHYDSHGIPRLSNREKRAALLAPRKIYETARFKTSVTSFSDSRDNLPIQLFTTLPRRSTMISVGVPWIPWS